jgi:hypothetical protein
MNFCWKFLIPLSLALLVLTVIVDKVATLTFSPVFLSTATIAAMLPRTVILLAVNLVIGAIALWFIAREGRLERDRIERRMAAVEHVRAAGT